MSSESDIRPGYTLAIVGSRDYPDLGKVTSYIDWFMSEDDGIHAVTLVSGGAKDVDAYAEQYINESWDAPVISLRPRKARAGEPGPYVIERVHPHGTSVTEGGFKTWAVAAHRRNALIVMGCRRLVAFWDGLSPGTESTIKQAIAQRRDYEVQFPRHSLVAPTV